MVEWGLNGHVANTTWANRLCKLRYEKLDLRAYLHSIEHKALSNISPNSIHVAVR